MTVRELDREHLELVRLYAGWPDARQRHRIDLAMRPVLSAIELVTAEVKRMPLVTAADARARAEHFRRRLAELHPTLAQGSR